jgi:hypothetical protein
MGTRTGNLSYELSEAKYAVMDTFLFFRMHNSICIHYKEGNIKEASAMRGVSFSGSFSECGMKPKYATYYFVPRLPNQERLPELPRLNIAVSEARHYLLNRCYILNF